MYGLEVPFGTLPLQWFFVLGGHDPGEFARPVSCRLFGLRGSRELRGGERGLR